MSNELMERIETLEDENAELKQAVQFMEENLESLDTAYVEAVNRLYDCKKMIQQVIDGQAGRNEMVMLLLELQSEAGKEEATSGKNESNSWT